MTITTIESGADAASDRMEQGNAKLPFLFEFLFLLFVEETSSDLSDFGFSENIFIGNDDFAIDAKSGRDTRDEVKIRGVKIAGGGEKAIQIIGWHNNQEERCCHQAQMRVNKPALA